MDTDPTEETGDGNGQSALEPTQEYSRKLRDLRPEKDPMGAGRPGLNDRQKDSCVERGYS